MVCNAKCTIVVNERGRFSKEEVERMVNEAERYNAEGETTSKNRLESHASNLRDTLTDLAACDRHSVDRPKLETR